MHPEARQRGAVVQAAALRDLVLMVREHEVETAAMDVERDPEMLLAIAEHSMCQPGRPRPQGLSQPGSSGGEGFHSTKSAASFL